MIFFVPMCQIFWHMGTGQRAVPLEPALWHPLLFLIFSLSAQCVRHFAPISSNLGSGPTKLTLKIFWNFFFQKKKFSVSLKWLIKISSKKLLFNKTSFFYFLVEFFKQKNGFLLFFDDFFVPMCQIFWHMGTGQRAVPLEPALWHPFFLFIFSLSAQCVRHFAPISSNLGSGPTKLTLAIFWNFFFQKKTKFPSSLKW